MRHTWLTLPLLLTACGGADLDTRLSTLESCDALDEAIREQEEDAIRWRFRFRWDFLPDFGGVDMVADGGEGAAPPPAYTDTNVQVEGVDEPDRVETDGTHLYALAADHLVVSRVWPTDTAEELARVQLPGVPRGLLLHRDSGLLVALSSVEGRRGDSEVSTWGTQLTLFDVRDAAAPVQLRQLWVQGTYRTARALGTRLYVATESGLSPPEVWRVDSAREAREASEAVGLEGRLPRRRDRVHQAGAWSEREEAAVGCGDVWISDRPAGTRLTTLTSLDLTDPTGTLASTGVVGTLQDLYVNHRSLYLAQREEIDGPFGSGDAVIETVLHRFDLEAAPPTPRYTASGEVPGWILDQFALDEHEGRLRVATTEAGTDGTSASVWVLAEEAGVLAPTGAVEGLAPGERIFAVRFMGPRGYLVTFRQTDPLFTLDLSDPTAPRTLGELEITGFSTYLHPLPGDRLLGVGMAGTEEGWIQAPQVSLFDVSDPAHPRLEARHPFEGGSSEAVGEHHAFTWSQEHQALVVPLLDGMRSSLVVLRVADGTIEALGRLEQDAVLQSTEADPWCTRFRRSVVLGDRVVGVSNAGLTLAPLASPAAVERAVPFPGLDACLDEGWWGGWGVGMPVD